MAERPTEVPQPIEDHDGRVVSADLERKAHVKNDYQPIRGVIEHGRHQKRLVENTVCPKRIRIGLRKMTHSIRRFDQVGELHGHPKCAQKSASLTVRPVIGFTVWFWALI